ncbi:SDR family oxidoreductase [Pseudophaeobacter sp.]|uniref:SDR family oxidoreductase n=1 Tax=Pseudophaeobacter sp. TaxID=1971739 RepID=UPI0032991551
MANRDNPKAAVLVLGGYGFIGAEVVRALTRAGHAVTVFGRDAQMARRVLPLTPFVAGDLCDFSTAQDWLPVIQGFDLVVNAAGQLQAPAAELDQVQHLAIAALAQACAEAGPGLVQISAAGASLSSPTEFMRSKAEADAVVLQQAAHTKVWVLKPGLVLGQGAFGGTGLLRMLAAVPLVQPLTLGQVQIQSVGLEGVAGAVVQAVQGDLPSGSYDLVEDHPQSLQEILAATRAWLGFAPARAQISLPKPLVRFTAWIADGLGHLGWRSPLRSTAIRVLEQGVAGDAAPYRQATGQGLAALPLIYAGLRAGREHRLEARMLLAMPFAVTVLALFWFLSGAISLFQLEAAARHLTQQGWGGGLARVSVGFWALVDIGLALALLWRPWAREACLGMVAVTVFYLGAATLVTPQMWSDPLGPLVKTLPGLMLALITWQLLQER